MRNIYNVNHVPKQLLTCGVRRDKNNRFIMDFKQDYLNDILNLVGPEIVDNILTLGSTVREIIRALTSYETNTSTHY